MSDTAKHRSRSTVQRIRGAAKRRGITQTRIALAAGVRPQTVCHVFAERIRSRRILDTARRLIAEYDGLTPSSQSSPRSQSARLGS